MARKNKAGSGQTVPQGPVPPPPTPTQGSGPVAGFAQVTGAERVTSAAPPQKARHTGWIVSGLVLITLAGIGALIVGLSLVSEVTVLAAARPIGAGEVIEAGDLEEVQLPSRLGNIGVRATELDRYLGQQTTGPLGEGALIHPDQFTEPDGTTIDELVVGVALGPDEYPRIGLREGDTVRVFELTGDNVGFDASEVGVASEVGLAEVTRVVGLQQPDNFLFSLRVDAALSPLIVDRASQGRIALALVVSGESGDDGQEADGPTDDEGVAALLDEDGDGQDSDNEPDATADELEEAG